jgi:hypothetical protein
MSRTSTTRAGRAAAATGTAVAGILVAAGPALAASSTTTLSNGADLTVTVDSPTSGDTYLVPAGSTTVDVPLTGTASVGAGAPSVSWVYVFDVSGSTGQACSTTTILECEKEAVAGLNDLVVADGSAVDVGIGAFGTNAAAADISSAAGEQLVTAPGSPDVDTVIDSVAIGGIGQFTPRSVGSGSTNYAAALQAAATILGESTGTTKNVVFLSDGGSNTGGGAFDAALTAVTDQATVYPFAVGPGAGCGLGTGGTLDEMATASGTTCSPVPDPADLPDVITNVVATSLDALEVTVDGTPVTATTAPALPQDGPSTVHWTATAAGLAPGSHEVCATATGTGPKSDGSAEDTATRCETFTVLGVGLTPPTATNELGSDDTHTVTATVSGPDGELGGRQVTFSVSAGPNAGETGTCAPADCTTGDDGRVTFTYTVPQEPDSLGEDTISATVEAGGDSVTIDVTKLWQDTTAPVVRCVAGPNPDGQVPAAPGKGGQGQNQDGYYRLVATDDVWPEGSLEVHAADDGSSAVFGPFTSGTDVKWTEANGATPSQRPGTGEVEWRLKGRGDLVLSAVDGSGNTSEPVTCAVPNAPQ